ncbi:MAG: hypothetical protein FWF02_14555 [Micrococcales bacterium]|nr:hypothetical protein [Micrococcales bacterium]MCL2668899.1 hypothetical protein [Micrococcales bacterium]
MALGRARPSRIPTLPQGETVAQYDTYLAAQQAVDHLADKEFPVQNVTIVGTDLQMVERVLSRLSYSRVAIGGALSGAWFGLFVGLLFSLLGDSGEPLLFPAIFIGAGFGMLFSVISYSLSRGRRDFTSVSQIVASHYALLCSIELAHRARMLLDDVGGVVRGAPAPTPAPSDGPSVSPAP